MIFADFLIFFALVEGIPTQLRALGAETYTVCSSASVYLEEKTKSRALMGILRIVGSNGERDIHHYTSLYGRT